MKEEIKRFRNTEYYVSNTGKVYSKKRKEMIELKQGTTTNGYNNVMLYFDKKRRCKLIHRLVAECFLENYSEYLQVNHIDCNRKNNNIINLEMVTCKENTNHTQKVYYNRNPFNIRITNINNDFDITVKTYKEAQIIMGYKHRSSILNLLNGCNSRKGYRLEKIFI